ASEEEKRKAQELTARYNRFAENNVILYDAYNVLSGLVETNFSVAVFSTYRLRFLLEKLWELRAQRPWLPLNEAEEHVRASQHTLLDNYRLRLSPNVALAWVDHDAQMSDADQRAANDSHLQQ